MWDRVMCLTQLSTIFQLELIMAVSFIGLISQTPPFIIQQSVTDFMVNMTDFRDSFIGTLIARKTPKILSKFLLDVHFSF
jgi:hypothetical protein